MVTHDIGRIKELIKDGLKEKETLIYKETLKKIDALYINYQSEAKDNEEGKQEILNEIMNILNDLILYSQMHENKDLEYSEILNKKCYFLKEMFFFESNKRSSDSEKSLILINTLIKLKESLSSDKNQSVELIELLKQRGSFFHDFFIEK